MQKSWVNSSSQASRIFLWEIWKGGKIFMGASAVKGGLSILDVCRVQKRLFFEQPTASRRDLLRGQGVMGSGIPVSHICSNSYVASHGMPPCAQFSGERWWGLEMIYLSVSKCVRQWRRNGRWNGPAKRIIRSYTLELYSHGNSLYIPLGT